MHQLGRRVNAALAGVATAAMLAALPASTAAASPKDPAANRSLSQATYSACSTDPASSECISSALADINAARAAESVRAMVLPTGFASMSVPEQLLNLANLERVDRGLSPILGLSAALDRDAQAAAVQDRDPTPTHLYGDVATSNWAGGFPSTLEADFAWMYDDGLGSGNLDCTASDQSGCWGHRHDILWQFSSPTAMGAGYGTGRYGASMAEVFVGGDTRTGAGQADEPIVRPSQVTTSGSSGTKPASTSQSAGPGQGPRAHGATARSHRARQHKFARHRWHHHHARTPIIKRLTRVTA